MYLQAIPKALILNCICKQNLNVIDPSVTYAFFLACKWFVTDCTIENI